MLKVLAVVRSIFLVFIVGYSVRAIPPVLLAKTFDEQYARCSSSLGASTKALWIAVAWIALETAIGWWLATRKRRAAAAPATPPAPTAP